MAKKAKIYYFRKGDKPMATQMQATPEVTGKYAREILAELKREQTPQDKKFIEDSKEFFRHIPRRGDK